MYKQTKLENTNLTNHFITNFKSEGSVTIKRTSFKHTSCVKSVKSSLRLHATAKVSKITKTIKARAHHLRCVPARIRETLAVMRISFTHTSTQPGMSFGLCVTTRTAHATQAVCASLYK